jgi:hypothetical protein
MDDPKRCANPVCTCTAAEKEEYCSRHCEEVEKDTVEGICQCGHRGCGRDALDV